MANYLEGNKKPAMAGILLETQTTEIYFTTFKVGLPDGRSS